ncbi:beta-glucosidase [Ephemerocybe angulata]|uniref:beta-glucosidase n=1 Tax=Ephemerocybe angulata TaxID=980116 RepID=A0A8H6IFZ4_9AGAR|nr:beta-glucosidase [Tulosesus angulatus]
MSGGMNRSFLTASVEELVKKMKTDEKVALLSAPNWWNTSAIPRLEIPSVRMSDGPNGVRGSSHFVSTPAQCLPCATSLASTFDPEIVHQAGVFLAKEAKIKASTVLLAPTCNIQRTPLGGRSFESFSEDPHLSGTMSAAYVNGLQSEGVAASIKHFVANDQEHERTAAESVMSERALREVYLYPFMWAQKHAKLGAIMTAYGRIKGVHCSENRELLQTILRDEWKFDGIVISDWFGTYGVDGAINAGLDLEMPGPPRWRTMSLVMHCLSAQKLLMPTIDERVTNMLRFIQRQAKRNPEVVYGDGIERSRDDPELRQFCRSLAADGIVLLKNEGEVLPLVKEASDKGAKKRVLVTGANLHANVISGGGSAQLKPTYVATPWQSINEAAPEGYNIIQSVGCYAHKYLPTLESKLTTPDGKPGWRCTFYAHNEANEPTVELESFVLNDTRVKLNDFLPSGLTEEWTIKLNGTLKVEESGPFELGLTVAGRAKLWLDGQLTIDNWTNQTPGDFFYGQGTVEEKAVVNLIAGKPVQVRVEYTNTSPPDGADENGAQRLAQPALMKGVRLGGCPKIDAEEGILEAVAKAKNSDVVVVIAGLSPEWESEGFDRPSLTLPGKQDELIQRLSEANENVVVVVQAGSAVSMPWVNNVAGILQTWYSGNEVGNALADVLFGKVNPGGKLPITLPVREMDIPAYLNDKSENGQIHYREDLYVGYKYYQARGVKSLFPFGFGLSYTSFETKDLMFSLPVADGGNADLLKVQAEVNLTNTGNLKGSEVVQLYVSYPSSTGLSTPTNQLRAFRKEKGVAPGETRKVTLDLDKYAFAFWDVVGHQWKVAPGAYEVHVGNSSENQVLHGTVVIEKAYSWKGL